MTTGPLVTRDAAAPPGSAGITCLSFVPYRKGTLRGFACIHIPRWRLKLFNVTLHVKGDSHWCALPSKPRLTRDGEVERDPATGRVQYAQLIAFDDPSTLRQFSHAAVAAIVAYAGAGVLDDQP